MKRKRFTEEQIIAALKEVDGGACDHILAVKTVKQPKRRECEECVKAGSRWVHLQTCQECGGTN
jgi:hypothetical protein